MCSQTFVNQQQYLSSCVNSHCVVPEKNPYPPHGRSLEMPRGKGVLKAKILEAKYEAKLKSLWWGGGCKTEKPSVGGGVVKIIFRTTHYTCNQYPKYRERCWSSSITCRWP